MSRLDRTLQLEFNPKKAGLILLVIVQTNGMVLPNFTYSLKLNANGLKKVYL